MNDIRKQQVINQYKDYYKFYNTVVRPIQETLPEKEVNGAITWNEEDVQKPVLAIVGGNK